MDPPIVVSSDVENGTSILNEREMGVDRNSPRGIAVSGHAAGGSRAQRTTMLNQDITGVTIAGGSDTTAAPLSTLGLSATTVHGVVISETTPSDIGNASNA